METPSTIFVIAANATARRYEEEWRQTNGRSNLTISNDETSKVSLKRLEANATEACVQYVRESEKHGLANKKVLKT